MTVLFATLFLLLAACGDGNGNGDTVLTGFSGVLIFGIIVYVIYRKAKKS